MKLTGNLKKEVDNIDTKEGKKEAIRKAGMVLTDDELEIVSGGCEVVNRIIGIPQCDCSGEYVDMIAIGTDEIGRQTHFQCPLCGATTLAYC